jgi:hypothetical protein
LPNRLRNPAASIVGVIAFPLARTMFL